MHSYRHNSSVGNLVAGAMAKYRPYDKIPSQAAGTSQASARASVSSLFGLHEHKYARAPGFALHRIAHSTLFACADEDDIFAQRMRAACLLWLCISRLDWLIAGQVVRGVFAYVLWRPSDIYARTVARTHHFTAASQQHVCNNGAVLLLLLLLPANGCGMGFVRSGFVRVMRVSCVAGAFGKRDSIAFTITA